MRNISEITINGKALRKILDAHYKYLTTSTMEGRADLRNADLRNANRNAIRNAYRSLSRIHHPDVGGTAEDFRRLTTAFDQAMKAVTV